MSPNCLNATTMSPFYPCTQQNKTTCVIGPEDYAGHVWISFRITVFHTAWMNRPKESMVLDMVNLNATMFYQMKVREKTKPGPPENVTAVRVNAGCINVSWSEPQVFSNCSMCEKKYQVDVRDGNGSKVVSNAMVKAKPYPKSGEKVQVCLVKPYREYKVYLRLSGDTLSTWSDWATVDFTTQNSIPTSGPPLDETSYHTELCDANSRDVTVYWQTPPSYGEGVELLGFKVSWGHTTTFLSPELRYFQRNANCLMQHTIEIYSLTNLGESLTPSNILIPEEKNELETREIDFRVEEDFDPKVSINTKNILVMWDGTYLSSVTIVIYICQEFYLPKTCSNDQLIFKIPATVSLLNVTDLSVSENLFGYALEHIDGRKHGITWTNCVYRPETVPEKPTKVSVVSGQSYGSITVIWESSQCSRETKVFIRYYEISVCRLQQDIFPDTNCTLYQVSSSHNNYNVLDLDDATLYLVYIRAVTNFTKSPFSDPQTALTRAGKINKFAVLIPFIFPVVAMITMCVGCFLWYMCSTVH
ncbi:uncharacterized protein LOC131948961 [Physella acuta]|uniref:uncharacterized protein LOC131948961 n=1 Tax=Physella acuta TaxID=109671 RepID=UPI0027DC328B|nr:uncharacterized protein LOC131948961 [Physella acuta]